MAKKKDKAEEDAQAQAEAEAKKKEQKAKREEEAARKAKAKSDYERMVAEVESLVAMTDTDAWKKIYGQLRAYQQKHRDALVDCKTSELAGHQAAVKAVDFLVESVQQPLGALNALTENYPLFVKLFKKRAEFSAALGTVTVRTA